MPLRAGTMHCWSLLMPLRPDKTFNDRTNRNAAVTRHMDTPHNGWIINYHNCPSWYWLTVVVKNWLMWLWLSKIVDSRLLTIWWQINTNLVPCLIYKLGWYLVNGFASLNISSQLSLQGQDVLITRLLKQKHFNRPPLLWLRQFILIILKRWHMMVHLAIPALNTISRLVLVLPLLLNYNSARVCMLTDPSKKLDIWSAPGN